MRTNAEGAGTRWAKGMCLVHALLASALWALSVPLDIEVPVRIWVFCAAAWPLWLGFAVFSPKEERVAWIRTIAVGLVILLPTTPTLYRFLVWSIGGFAP
jgi:hypothetical protein